MGEHDDLPVGGERHQHLQEPLDLRRIHGLYRVVEDDEPERALGGGGPRDEDGQRQRLQLALAHHAESVGVGAVDPGLQQHPAAGLVPEQLDPGEFDVALLPQRCPDRPGLVRQQRDALIA